MKARIEVFFSEIDEALRPVAGGESLIIYHIGRSALVWEYDYPATTSDIDAFRPDGDQRLIDFVMKLFGQGTDKSKEHGLYLELVDKAMPPAPAGFEKRAKQVHGPWEVLQVFHLEAHDLAATKLRRFSAKDREDIRMLCDRGVLDEQRLEEALEKAFRFNLAKDGDQYRDDTFDHLRVVQRYLRGEIREF